MSFKGNSSHHNSFVISIVNEILFIADLAHHVGCVVGGCKVVGRVSMAKGRGRQNQRQPTP